MTTKQRGDIAEMMFVAWCLEHDLSVSLPVGDSLPYDVIVDRNGQLLRIQVKTVGPVLSNDTARIPVVSTTTKNGQWTYPTYVGKIDGLVAYDSLQRKFYYFKEVELRTVRMGLYIRLQPTKNNQSKGIRTASSYELTDPSQL